MGRLSHFRAGDRVVLSTRRYELVKYEPLTDTWHAVDLKDQRHCEIDQPTLESFGELERPNG